MKVVDGLIVEITELELFSLYLDRDMDDALDFLEYKNRFAAAGCVITPNGCEKEVPNEVD